MKQKLLGILLMIVGATMFFVSTALFTASAQSGDDAPYVDDSETVTLAVGDYNCAGEVISVLDDGTVILPNEAPVKYELVVWRKMPITDEQTGKITYKNLYFVDCGENRLDYYPDSDTLKSDGKMFELI